MSQNATGTASPQQETTSPTTTATATATQTQTGSTFDIDQWLNETAASKFIKLEAGQTLVLTFDPKKMNPVERDFNGKKTRRMEFGVITEQGEEKTIEFSPGWVRMIHELLKEGWRKLKVTRHGAGMETTYTFIPVPN